MHPDEVLELLAGTRVPDKEGVRESSLKTTLSPEVARAVLSKSTNGAIIASEIAAMKLPRAEIIHAAVYEKRDLISKDPDIGWLVNRLRARIASGNRPTTEEVKALALWTTSELCANRSPDVRAQAARLLMRCASHEEQLKLGVMREQGQNTRHRERIESKSKRLGSLGLPIGGAIPTDAGPKLRLPRAS